MGLYRIEIEATGGHGCKREAKDGQTVYGCRNMGCPDCRTRELVEQLQRMGNQVSKAVFTHWPGQPSEVQDDLLTRTRKGSFND